MCELGGVLLTRPAEKPEPAVAPLGSSERPASGFRSPEYSAFTLRDGRHEVALHEGETLIGRSAECTLILDSVLVSRRHVLLVVRGDRVVLHDLGSRNGTSVDGEVVANGTVDLRPGARLLIGSVELELVRRATPQTHAPDEMRRAPTVTVGAVRLDDERVQPAGTVSDAGEENTRTSHVFELLGGVMEKALALGNTSEAIRLLGTPINQVWQGSQKGQPAAPQLADSAADYAVRLAEATKDDSWVTKALDIFVAQQRPLPLPVIDRLYSMLRRLSAANCTKLGAYVESIQHRRGSLSAAERFALQRLEGLYRLASL